MVRPAATCLTDAYTRRETRRSQREEPTYTPLYPSPPAVGDAIGGKEKR